MNNLPQIEVYFLLTCAEDNLKTISDEMGINPTDTRTKQEFPQESIDEGIASNLWIISTKKQSDKTISCQCNKLVEMLKDKEDKILDLINRYSLIPDITVVVNAESANEPEMILPKDIIKFAAKIEAEIGFDIYIY
jgi:hypothetical protein